MCYSHKGAEFVAYVSKKRVDASAIADLVSYADTGMLEMVYGLELSS